jgi:hypothetical protein
MNTCTLPATADLQRGWLRRWRNAAIAGLRAWQERRAEERSARLVDGLDTRLLADIGAPDWMHARAALRDDRRARQFAELERGAPW